MRSLLFFALACLLALASCHPYRNYGDYHGHKFEGQAKVAAAIYFDGCYEETCQKEQYHGFDCHAGKCKRICDFNRCWEPEYKRFSGKAEVVADVYFEGCYEKKCQKHQYHGFDCHQGHCARVCDFQRCWETEPKRFSVKAKIHADIYFDGCYEETCRKDNYHGFDCYEGYCGRVCDPKSCWEPQYEKFSGKATLKADIYFDGCYEETCHKGDYHGYNCHDEQCGHVCRHDVCWEPEYKSFSGKAKLHADIYFEGCYEETCHKNDYHGFDCYEGYCGRVCDLKSCWEPQYKMISGKATLKADIYFDGCYEETCHKDDYRGFDCYEGQCDRICDRNSCWEPEYKKVYGKATLKADIYFDGCYEETCHKGEYDGYNCNKGLCDFICKGYDCFTPKKSKSYGY